MSIQAKLIIILGTALLISITAPSPIKAEQAERNNTFLHIFFTPVWGQAQEMVFYHPEHLSHSWEDDVLSELLWDIPGVFFLGAEASLGIGNLFQVSLSIHTKVHSSLGNMTNTDWINGSGTFFGNNAYDWTNYSRSDTWVDEAWKIDARISIMPRKTSLGAVLFHAGIKRQEWSWTDRAWEFIYSWPPSGFETETDEKISGAEFRKYKGTFEGENAIDYRQSYFIPYAGFSMLFFMNSLYWETGLFLSPHILATARDHHKLRNEDTYFYDYAAGGVYFGMETSIEYFTNGPMSLLVSLSGALQPVNRGITYAGPTDDPNVLPKAPEPSGIGQYTLSCSVGLKYHF